VTTNVPVATAPAAFGLFVAATQTCDQSDLEAALATSQTELAACQSDLARATAATSQCQAQLGDCATRKSQLEARVAQLEAATSQCQAQLGDCAARKSQLEARVAQLEAANAALAVQYQALRVENERLRGQTVSLTDLVRSMVRALFGERPNAAVAAAARDTTRPVVEAALAVAAGDPRLVQVQRALNAGEAAVNSGDWPRALQEFREAYTQAERIRGERAFSSKSPR
jgi:chromosome segregation ATPase